MSGDPAHLAKFMQDQFNHQMESLCNFIFDNHENVMFHTTQGARISKGPTKRYVGSTQKQFSSRAEKHALNTFALYKSWRTAFSIQEPKRKIMIRYDESVPEIHAVLDYIEESKSNDIEVSGGE